METPWAAIKIDPDGRVSVFVHNWISAGSASTPQELWDIVHSGWTEPEKFWQLFYQQLDSNRGAEPRPRKGGDPKLAALTLDDLGI